MNRQVTTLFFSRVLQAVISFVTLKLSLLYLTPSELAIFYLLVSAISFICFSFISPMHQFGNRMAHEWEQKELLWDSLRRIIQITVIVAISYATLSTLLFKYTNYFSTVAIDHVFLILVFGVMSSSLVGFIPALLNILGKYKYYAFSLNLNVLLILFFSVAFCLAYSKTGTMWIFGKIVGEGIVAILGILYAIRYMRKTQIRFEINPEFYRQLISFSLPLIFAAALMWAQNEGYRFLIKTFLSYEFLGLLVAGLTIATRISSLVETFAHQVILPEFYRSITNATKARAEHIWNKTFNYLMPLYIGTMIFIASVSPYLIRIFGSEQYFHISYIVMLGSVIEFFRMINNLLSQIAHIEKNTKKLVWPYVFGTIAVLSAVTIGSLIGKSYLPIFLVLGNLISFVILFFIMHKSMTICLDFYRLVLSIVISLPMLSIWLFSFNNTDLQVSLTVTVGCGVYLLLTQFVFYRHKLRYDDV